MSNLSIKVIIAGRTYPLNIKEEEKALIEKAAEDINKSVNFLKENFAVKDAQDLLAMTALQLATKKSESGQKSGENNLHLGDLESDLEKILKRLNSVNID